jgi:diadenosine tetraphosphatase ApaH/serine/threonine PP2A family protein phosphatase
VIEGLKVLLRGGVAVPSAESVFTVERSAASRPRGRRARCGSRLGLFAWFGSAPQELQPVLQAMLVARVLEPASKLATHRMLHDDTATTSLGRVLGVGQCSADDLYRALDWLHDAQAGIERRLARQHLVGSTLVLYDLTSTWLTGRCCELAARGHSRDGKRDDPQIVFGLVCTAEGCPIAVEVFKGNTADPATVAAQVASSRSASASSTIAWAGDRGMLTSARIEQVLKPQGMDWVSSLRAPQIAQLAAEHGPFQPSLFDERNLLELTSEHFPGERLVVCRNPALAEERARKRLELLRPPRPIWPRSPRPRSARAARCVASRPSRCAWVASSSASTWPSTWRFRSPTTA